MAKIYEDFANEINSGISKIAENVFEMMIAKDGGNAPSNEVVKAIQDSIGATSGVAILGCTVAAIVDVLAEDPNLSKAIEQKLHEQAKNYLESAESNVITALQNEGIL